MTTSEDQTADEAAAAQAAAEAAAAAAAAAAAEEQRKQDLRSSAQAGLALPALVAQRCAEEGIAVPPEWTAYLTVLEETAAGTRDEALPHRPAYPAGLLTKNVNGEHLLLSKEEQDAAKAAWAADDAARPAQLWTEVRAERDRRLAASDWTQLPDSPLASEKKEAWAACRAELRAVPETQTDPANIVWPPEPS